MKSRLLPCVMALLVGLIVLAGVGILDHIERERFHEASRAHVLEQLSAVRARLEGALNTRLFLTQGLVAHVSTHPEIGEAEFEQLASVILAGHTAIRAIQQTVSTTRILGCS